LIPAVISLPVVVVILEPLLSHLAIKLLLLDRGKPVVVSSSPILSQSSSLIVPVMLVPVPAIIVSIGNFYLPLLPITRRSICVVITVPVIV
jgi:hypothetical protein